MKIALAGTAALLAFVGSAICSPLAAQAHDHSQHAGHEVREIKALSPDDVEALRTGAGLGFALPAELNHFPGPLHVIELASQLGLRDDQLARVREIRQDMLRTAIDAGLRYLEAERALDRFFVDGGTDQARLRSLIADADRLRGEVRFIHLRAHVLTTALLSPDQIRNYDRLRGYTGHAEHR